MRFTLIPLLISCSYLLIRLLSPHQQARLSWHVCAQCVGLSYGLFFISALPLVWIGKWSLQHHAMIIAGLSGVLWAIHYRRNRASDGSTPWSFSRWCVAILVVSTAFGMWRQWNPIHYLYATHDPGAYLDLAHHVARTGTFEVNNELAQMAKTDSALSVLLGQNEEAPLDWQQAKSYGVIPKADDNARGGFHGFFGTPLMLAAGIEMFGERHALRIQWLHFATTLVLLAACALKLSGGKSVPAILAMMLFASTPLVHPIFREPLSEPATGVCFLSMLYFSLHFSRSTDYILVRLGFVFCLAAALCLRISSLIYVPFALVILMSSFDEQDRRHTHWAFLPAMGLLVLACAGTAFYVSPAYLQDILLFYVGIVTEKLPFKIHPTALAITGSLLSGLVLYAGKKLEPKILGFGVWRSAWKMFAIVLAMGIAFRYVRLVTRLTHNIGGYPFVLFNLDSLLFYGSPIVTVVGFAYWYFRLSAKADRDLYFLQWLLPFLVFFYWVYRFIPLNLQPNFQRYLLIELVPLAVLGMALLMGKWVEQRRRQIWVATLVLATFGWNLVLGEAIRHENVASESFSQFQQVRRYLSTKRDPVVVAIRPGWMEMAFLVPLANAFGFPQGYVHFPFSFRAAQGLRALAATGKTVLLAIPAREVSGSTLRIGNSAWQQDFAWSGCYAYPQIGLGAPPFTLEKSCADLRFFERREDLAEPEADSRLWKLAWRDRLLALPIEAGQWVGFRLNGPKACKTGDKTGDGGGVVVFSAVLGFAPSTEYSRPTMRLNGEIYGAPGHELTLGPKGIRAAHEVELAVSTRDLNCLAENQVDLYFGKQKASVIRAGFRTLRPGEDITTKILKAASNQ